MTRFAQWCVGITALACSINMAMADPTLPIDKIVIFGDSLTDDGNLFALTKWGHEHIPAIPIIPKPPYWQGRFSDGPVWNEYLVQAFADGDYTVPVLNYAFGGAWAENAAHTHQPFPPDFNDEVNYYLATHLHDDKNNTLFIIFMGANDYLMGRDDPETAATEVVAAQKKVVAPLIWAGARQIIFVGMPDLGKIPRAVRLGPWYEDNLRTLSAKNNQELQQLVRTLTKWSEWFSGLRVSYLDADALMESIYTHAADYHITDKTHACYGGWPVSPATIKLPLSIEKTSWENAWIEIPLAVNTELAVAYIPNSDAVKPPVVCDNPAEHLFWDEVHPTTHAYKIFAKMACGKVADFGYGVAAQDGTVKALQCDRV